MDGSAQIRKNIEIMARIENCDANIQNILREHQTLISHEHTLGEGLAGGLAAGLRLWLGPAMEECDRAMCDTQWSNGLHLTGAMARGAKYITPSGVKKIR